MTLEVNTCTGSWLTCCTAVSALTAIPLLIVGSLAGVGSVTAVAMGGVAIGFGVLRLPSQNIFQGITLIVLGILAIMGLVSGPALGFTAVGFAALDILITCALSSCGSAGIGAQCIGMRRLEQQRAQQA